MFVDGSRLCGHNWGTAPPIVRTAARLTGGCHLTRWPPRSGRANIELPVSPERPLPSSDLRDQLQATLSGSYTLERELGGGGMSRVFVAEERALGRRVVIKTLLPELAAGVSVERFKREIRLAARLQHPHIVPLLAAGDSEGLLWYTMPLVEGESLRERLARSPLPLDEALGVLRDVALALEYAHARQVVHRDIKPENILLSGRSAVVTDFGIAKAISAARQGGSPSPLTTFGTVVGTPAYIAPEQAAGDAVDSRADLYAWGVIAYELLAGAHPFASRTTAQAVLAAHIAETPVPLADRRPGLPAVLTRLVDRCLAKNPSQRPADASALLAQLGDAAHPQRKRGLRLAPAQLVPAIVVILLLAGTGTWLYLRTERRRWARETALPEIARLNEADRSLAAFLLLKRAAQILPADTKIAHIIEAGSDLVSVASSPSGATVAINDYLTPDSAWYPLGTTPLNNIRIPDGYFRWKVAKQGIGEYITAPLTTQTMVFALDSALGSPEGMVPVSGGWWGDMIAFVGWVGPYKLPPYYIDRFEVTNRQFQEFIDKGGYEQPKYWGERFVHQGRELIRDQAMAMFRDRTGRAGPSTWEGGHYPEGRAAYPVSGVSWYEASAYAAFAGKSLPTFAQWFKAAPAGGAKYVVLSSNISRSDPAPVGSFKGLGSYGTYDMAGNVREWTANALDADRRFILGGASKSPTYLYAVPEALSPFDRSPENGFRCVRNVEPLPPEVTRPIKPLDRDFSTGRPASDEVFRAYQVMYAYQKSPLNAKVEGVVQDSRDWREEKITFDAAYGGERMAAYLFLPKNVKPPYQTIVFFPSARVLSLRSSETLGDTKFFDYVVQSGRAVMYPIYQETYERRARRERPGAAQAIDLTVQRFRDLGRSLDYLQTRPDMAGDKLGYMGVSMGAAEGVIYATLAQDRLGAVVFLDGGFFLGQPPAGGDQADFAPRLKKPVLMVNGRYDFTFPLERAQIPLYRMLGTASADKQHVVLETPHDVTALRPALISAVLGFLDKYLGRVR
jgi:eukaryotic-like serine/threonine-protein kinase